MAQIIQMTNEQLQQLIEAVRISATSAAAASASGVNPNASKSKASMSDCPVNFWGDRDHESVESFITGVCTYKEIESISNEDAVKGISLLFKGIASTWWQGIRKEAKSWDDVIRLIREHFSPAKPAYQVYMEIFEKKQDETTAIDTFVCQKRALLAQLPDGRHDEETEIDLIYGLVNLKYRKHISRHEIQTFKELLEKGRIIEHNNLEIETETKKGGPRRCSYCNYRGHTNTQCRKKRKDDQAASNNKNNNNENENN